MDDEMIKMLVLLLGCTFLFPNSILTIGKSFLKHIDSIEEMKRISWPKMIHSELMKRIETYKDEPKKLSSCVFILKVNLFVKLRLII
ncbi:hypothetical protein ACHQM5_003952 [Ranunculus cassubicifolius]